MAMFEGWRRMWFRRRRRIGPVLVAADRARAKGDWDAAVRGYAAIVAEQPDRHDIWIQLGHASKERGDPDGAATAYGRAVALSPDDAETWLHLADVLRTVGRRAEAIDAFATAAVKDPTSTVGRDALEEMGAHDRVPMAFRSMDRRLDALENVVQALAATRQVFDAFSRTTAFPIGAYDDFRHAYPIARAPSVPAGRTLRIVVAAQRTQPWQLRATLDALLAAHHADWSATVLAGSGLAEHPVAGIAVHEPRIGFVDPAVCSGGSDGSAEDRLLIDAGTVPDPEAFGWFLFAAGRTAAGLLYCDEDRVTRSWQGERRFTRPMFHAVGDGPSPSLLFVASGCAVDGIAEWQAGRGTLGDVIAAADGLRVGHVPRLLASVVDLPTAAVDAPVDAPAPSVAARAVTRGVAAPPAGRIAVIVPTRDQAGYLRTCVQSLLAKADDAGAIDVVVVDNRSRDAETTASLGALSAAGARIVTMDEPFNWSRANNLAAAAAGDAEILSFANNDIEVLTEGWDTALRRHLADPRIGLVGARLLYPDRTIQHVGIVLGMNGGLPMHEGVGMAGGEPGPGGRWRRSRDCAAVTGAFMAMRRDVHARVGGFEERDLPLGYNDIDMCLRVRAAGLRVRYVADVEVVHHESKTRGMNVTQGQVAWDNAELAALYARWGGAMMEDLGYNPHWNRRGRPFEAFREPDMAEILAHLDRSARVKPWLVERAAPPA